MLRCIVAAQTVNIYAYDSKITTDISRKQTKNPNHTNKTELTLNQTKKLRSF